MSEQGKVGEAYQTFTIVARCPWTGAFGVALASHPMSIGARCPFVRSGIGAAATQAYTNPTLGPMALDLLASGETPEAALASLAESDSWFEYRQVAIVGADGTAVAYSGPHAPDWKGHVVGAGFVALGNNITGEHVITAMARSFEQSAAAGVLLEERLMMSLEAGREAIGLDNDQRSGALIVCGRESYPRTDLRVDLAEPNGRAADAVAALRRVFDAYKPLIPYYEEWPKDPSMPGWRDWLRDRE